jgi:hypothetical protein
MCLEDVVVDTNVFVHTGNPGCKHFDASCRAVDALVEGAAILCVDHARLIEGEYMDKIPEQSLGRSALARLLASDRVRPVQAVLQPGDRRWLRQRVADPRDRTFVAVATKSVDRVLLSNDEADFDNATRAEVLQKFRVTIAYASQGVDLLAC